MANRVRLRSFTVIPVLLAALGPACGEDEPENRFSGTLAPPGQGSEAVTYDPALAPEGARLIAAVEGSEDQTTVTLGILDMLPDRGYAAHAHTRGCGATGADAGPHFQNEIDPAATPQAPSTDPAYANPDNEIWLDLMTDQNGSGETETTVPFTFGDRKPASIIVHADMMTATEPGKSGSAGARVACLNLPLK